MRICFSKRIKKNETNVLKSNNSNEQHYQHRNEELKNEEEKKTEGKETIRKKLILRMNKIKV